MIVSQTPLEPLCVEARANLPQIYGVYLGLISQEYLLCEFSAGLFISWVTLSSESVTYFNDSVNPPPVTDC